jgi:hypothetical protein
MAVADGDLFVAKYAGGSVTELNLDGGVGEGALGPAYKFDEPDALAVAGDDLFVANGAGNSVTEVPM